MFTFYAYSEVSHSFYSAQSLFNSCIWMCGLLLPFQYWLIPTQPLHPVPGLFLKHGSLFLFVICWLSWWILYLVGCCYTSWDLFLAFIWWSIISGSVIPLVNVAPRCMIFTFLNYLRHSALLQYFNKHFSLTIFIAFKNNSTFAAINWTVTKFNVN